MNRRTMIATAITSFTLMACCCGGGPIPQRPAPANGVQGEGENVSPTLPDTPEELIALFGKPDEDLDGTDEKPLPLLPIRSITYRKANVQAFYHPTNKEFPVKLPIQGYRLVQYQEARTRDVISHSEAANRMHKWKNASTSEPADAPKKSPPEAKPIPESTSAERPGYFVKIDEDKTLEGITPVRKWLTVSIVFRKQPAGKKAYDAIESEIRLVADRGLDVLAYVHLGDKNKKATWRQMRDTDGAYVFAEFEASTRKIMRKGKELATVAPAK